MNQIIFNRSENVALPQLAPNNRCRAIVSKVITAIADFFRTIGLWIAEAISRFKELYAITQSLSSTLFYIVNIPAQERANVLENTLPLINNQTSGFDRREILDDVARIPARERANVVENSLRLINDQTDGFCRRVILGEVARIPVQQRASVVENTLPLINDQMNGIETRVILGKMADVPAQERANVVENSLRLINDQMNGLERREILGLVARILPQERENVVENALLLINDQMHADVRWGILRRVADVHVHERANVVGDILLLINDQMNAHERRNIIEREFENFQIAAEQDFEDLLLNPIVVGGINVQNPQIAAGQGIDVHAGTRDKRVQEAIKALREAQKKISSNEIDEAVQEFQEHLDGHKMSAGDKQLAKKALLGPRSPGESFGPLISKDSFSVLGLEVSGKELIGRLWVFASNLKEPDQTNAKVSMISALKDSYYMGSRVCNQGKIQRLVVGVLQGRLKEANIELASGMQLSTNQAVTAFFQVEAHQKIDKLEPLLAAADQFCNANSVIEREGFLKEIREYAKLNEIS